MNLDIYTDGSYNRNATPDIVTGGYVIIDRETKKVIFGRAVSTKRKDFVAMANIGGELIAAMYGIAQAAVTAGADATDSHVYVYHDYRGIKDFVDGYYKNVKYAGCPTDIYRNSVWQLQKMYPTVKLHFVKVKAHSGVYYNELVDRIAKGNSIPESVCNLLPAVEM